MGFVSSLPLLASLLAAIGTAFMLVKKFGAPPALGRYAAIDGLRGYLALFVFLHHASIWYVFLRSGQWQTPESHLFSHLGLSSVLVFFMITGFLFFGKLLDGRSRPLDWGRLFVSRALRLVPLYLFAMLLLFAIVLQLSHGMLTQPLPELFGGMLRWLGFTIFGAPNLNGYSYTPVIIAGVTWSLPYEWLFYCALPLLALTVGVLPPWPYLVLGLAAAAAIAFGNPQFHPASQMIAPLLSFLGGIAAALLVRWDGFCRVAAHRLAALVPLACLAWLIAAFPAISGPVPLLLLTVAFVFIACGNTLFGVLTSAVSRMLGELSYSLYLLHGIALFVLFNLVLDPVAIRSWTPLGHWLLVIGLTPMLVLVCFATFRWIEHPALSSTAAVTDWLRARLPAQPARE